MRRKLFNDNGMIVTADGEAVDYIRGAFDVRRFFYPPYISPNRPAPFTVRIRTCDAGEWDAMVAEIAKLEADRARIAEILLPRLKEAIEHAQVLQHDPVVAELRILIAEARELQALLASPDAVGP